MEKKKSGFSHDSAQTAYETGRAYYDAQDYDRAVACFLQAADAGHTDAENCLGCCYEAGQGIPRDDKAAVNHYRHAAWHGNVFAQYNLGNCYFLNALIVRQYIKCMLLDKTAILLFVSLLSLDAIGHGNHVLTENGLKVLD